MTIEYCYASPHGFYTHMGRALWEIEVDHSLRDLSVIAAGEYVEPRSHKAPGIRIRDTYCGELADDETHAIALSPVEARRLASALLARDGWAPG